VRKRPRYTMRKPLIWLSRAQKLLSYQQSRLRSLNILSCSRVTSSPQLLSLDYLTRIPQIRT